jgi:hypothetical protein
VTFKKKNPYISAESHRKVLDIKAEINGDHGVLTTPLPFRWAPSSIEQVKDPLPPHWDRRAI